MRRISVLVIMMSYFATGCAFFTAPVIPPVGGFFSNIESTLDVEFEDTRLGSKKGEATSSSVLSLFAFGDASAAAAVRDGGITTIYHADYKYFNVFFFYSSFTLVLYGD